MREFSLLVTICVGAITAFAASLLAYSLATGQGSHVFTELLVTVVAGGLITFLAYKRFRATPKKPTDI